jgi:hypothetical protein
LCIGGVYLEWLRGLILWVCRICVGPYDLLGVVQSGSVEGQGWVLCGESGGCWHLGDVRHAQLG